MALSDGLWTHGGTLCMRNYQIFQQLFSENLQISFIYENCHFWHLEILARRAPAVISTRESRHSSLLIYMAFCGCKRPLLCQFVTLSLLTSAFWRISKQKFYTIYYIYIIYSIYNIIIQINNLTLTNHKPLFITSSNFKKPKCQKWQSDKLTNLLL